MHNSSLRSFTIRPTIIAFFFFSCFLLLFCFPKISLQAARDGLSLWYQNILPTLFPAMVLSSFLVSTGLLSYLFPVVASSHFPNWMFVLLGGIFCGYPAGAKLCRDLLEQEKITEKQANILLCFVHAPSPMFVRGFTLTTCLPDCNSLAFLLSIYLPVPFLYLLATAFYHLDEKQTVTASVRSFSFTSLDFDRIYYQNVLILVKIAGYLIFFSILIRFICFFIPKQHPLVIFCGLLEMTNGLYQLSLMPYCSYFPAIALFFLCFGGLCIFFQVRDAYAPYPFPYRSYLCFRILHGLLAAFFYLVFSCLPYL